MEAKHTPGPWHHNYGYIVRNSNNDPVANCHYTEPLSMILQEQQLANARLIAAAPDMLEALRVAALVCAKQTGLSYADRREAHEMVLAAIAKAEPK